MTIQGNQNSKEATNISKSSIGFWTIISFIAIIFLLVGAFIIYINANPSNNLWVGAWKYLESATFRSLLPSVAVPILLFVFSIYDKTVKDIQAKREQQEEKRLRAIKEEEERKERRMKMEEERKERRMKMEEELKEKQLQAVEKTRDILKQINSLVSEVRFYDETSKMNDTLIRIASLSISVSEVINIWKLRFPILPKNVYSLFVDYLVVLYWGAWAVAHSIFNNKINNKKQELQEYLAMTQRGIVSISFDPIFNILNHSRRLLELTAELSRSNKDIVEDQIIEDLRSGIEKNFTQCFKPREGIIHKIIQYESNESNNFSPNKPLRAIWLCCEKKINEEIPSQMDKLIPNGIGNVEQNIKKKIESEIKGLIVSLFQLKVYHVLLRIDKFRDEEILPSNSSNSEGAEAAFLRESYQEMKQLIEPEGLTIDSDKFVELLNSDKYTKFKDAYFKIQETTFMNIIAEDTIKRMQEIGTLLRFASTIPFNVEDTKAVQ